MRSWAVPQGPIDGPRCEASAVRSKMYAPALAFEGMTGSAR